MPPKIKRSRMLNESPPPPCRPRGRMGPNANSTLISKGLHTFLEFFVAAMGVKGLSSYIRARVNAGPPPSPLAVLVAEWVAAAPERQGQKPTLLVDGNAFAFWLPEEVTKPTDAAPFPGLFGGDLRDIHVATHAFVTAIRSIGCVT